MPIDPLLADLLAHPDAPAPVGLSVAEEREHANRAQRALRARTYRRPPEPAAIEDRVIAVAGGEIPLRIYSPAGPEPAPIHLYLHGGGFWLGSIDGSDAACRELCVASGALVVSVGYRLAPEHRFPVPPEDCYAALEYVVANGAGFGGITTCVSIGGESAGANLAAVVALMARDRSGPPLVLQILSIPITDLTMSHPSIASCAEGYLLTRGGIEALRDHYLGGSRDPRDPRVSPLFAENLSGLPPALVVTMEFDPLRDEGEAYARRLVEAGVAVTQRRYLGLVHGSAMFTALLPQAQGYYDFLAKAMRAAHDVARR